MSREEFSLNDAPNIPRTTTTDEERAYFTRVMEEAKQARDHEITLAKIEANKQVDLVKAKQRSYDDRMWRKYFVAWVCAGIFVLTAGAGIWYIVNNVNKANRFERIQKEQIQQQTAQACIKEGNLWINNSCLIARKAT